jgi:hypothetical protein
LPQAATAFLDSSRIMFASGDKYAADFGQVSTILDRTSGVLENQKSTAEYQLVALEDSVSFLNLIETNTETTTELLAQLVALAPVTAAARAEAAAGGSIAAGGTVSTPPTIFPEKGVSDPIVTAVDSSATTSSTAITGSIKTTSEDIIDTIKTTSADIIWWCGTGTNRILNETLTAVEAGKVVEVTTAQPALAATCVEAPKKRRTWLDKLFGRYKEYDDPEDPPPLSFRKYAEGGLAPKGISLVGEKGPELVDFKTPGRVYSNKASNDIFNSKQLVEEIRSLRQEVNNLRKDQREQTGHLITATYDANAQNAEQVTAGTEDALQAQNWKERSQIKFA